MPGVCDGPAARRGRIKSKILSIRKQGDHDVPYRLSRIPVSQRESGPMAELPPQFVAIDGLSNFRDIGGWPIEDKDGKVIAKVRTGVIYRGPDTRTVTPSGIAKLKELGVTTDFDLRSKGQIEKLGGPAPMEGIQRIWAPAFPDGEYSPEKAAARYVQYASDGTEVYIYSLLIQLSI